MLLHVRQVDQGIPPRNTKEAVLVAQHSKRPVKGAMQCVQPFAQLVRFRIIGRRRFLLPYIEQINQAGTRFGIQTHHDDGRCESPQNQYLGLVEHIVHVQELYGHLGDAKGTTKQSF